MRVIAGEFRGRVLLGPESDVTRPVTDRVKQSLFDILTSHIADARVYDCFAGTGSMGLECLSRGAAHVTFFEADKSAVARLRRNIETLGVKDRTIVFSGDLFEWFDCTAHERLAQGQEARVTMKVSKAETDLIFLDPPYRFLWEKPQLLAALSGQFQHHLKSDGVVIFRHDAADSIVLPPLRVADVRNYGSMMLEFLRPATTDHGQTTTDK